MSVSKRFQDRLLADAERVALAGELGTELAPGRTLGETSNRVESMLQQRHMSPGSGAMDHARILLTLAGRPTPEREGDEQAGAPR